MYPGCWEHYVSRVLGEHYVSRVLGEHYVSRVLGKHVSRVLGKHVSRVLAEHYVSRVLAEHYVSRVVRCYGSLWMHILPQRLRIRHLQVPLWLLPRSSHHLTGPPLQWLQWLACFF